MISRCSPSPRRIRWHGGVQTHIGHSTSTVLGALAAVALIRRTTYRIQTFYRVTCPAAAIVEARRLDAMHGIGDAVFLQVLSASSRNPSGTDRGSPNITHPYPTA